MTPVRIVGESAMRKDWPQYSQLENAPPRLLARVEAPQAGQSMTCIGPLELARAGVAKGRASKLLSADEATLTSGVPSVGQCVCAWFIKVRLHVTHLCIFSLFSVQIDVRAIE